MGHSKCTGQSSVNFGVLALIRGTTPLMMWFAVMNLKSAGLVVAAKCGITLSLFLLSMLWYFFKDSESKAIVMKNLSNKQTYWKICKCNLFYCRYNKGLTCICDFQ